MFPVGAESGLKENDETHDLWVNLAHHMFSLSFK